MDARVGAERAIAILEAGRTSPTGSAIVRPMKKVGKPFVVTGRLEHRNLSASSLAWLKQHGIGEVECPVCGYLAPYDILRGEVVDHFAPMAFTAATYRYSQTRDCKGSGKKLSDDQIPDHLRIRRTES